MALAPCPHRPPCPGCPRWNDAEGPREALGRLATLARAAGLEPPAWRPSAPTGFRMRARLSVRGRAASPKIGLFQEGSHRIVDTPRCPIHDPRINQVAAELKAAIRATGTPPYAEGPHRGRLRCVQVVIERASGRAQVVLVARDSEPDSLSPLAEALCGRLGERLHSLWWNGNPERTNALLGPLWSRVKGPEAVCETLAGARVWFPPGAFGQSHLDMAEVLARAVQAALPDRARVAELYAGCGGLSLGALARLDRLTWNEVAPHGLRGLELARGALPEALRARTRVLPGTAGERAEEALAEAEVALVDPPRRGLDPEGIGALARSRIRRLVYVSCRAERLEADVAELRSAGFRLASLEAFDAFPHTEHVEALAVLERRPGSRPAA